MRYYHMEFNNNNSNNNINKNKNSEIIIAEPKREIKYEPPKKKAVDVAVYNNKWQQLLSAYPRVHICAEAESILIKPADIVVLREGYHGLAANSFLLHAYYNYRQLILFYYTALGEYYIGVPGIYYERQKRIAAMFGFEGFEGGNEEGCFGYYMKKVEL